MVWWLFDRGQDGTDWLQICSPAAGYRIRQSAFMAEMVESDIVSVTYLDQCRRRISFDYGKSVFSGPLVDVGWSHILHRLRERFSHLVVDWEDVEQV